MMGLKVSEKALQEIVEEVDEDGSGELEFEEFCILSAKFLIEEDEESLKEELKEAFRIYDKEGNGYITTQVLKEIDNRLSAEDIEGIVDEVDEDGSGTLDFDEFMEMMSDKRCLRLLSPSQPLLQPHRRNHSAPVLCGTLGGKPRNQTTGFIFASTYTSL